MAIPKVSGKKTATTTAKRTTAKPSAKATGPKVVAYQKGYIPDIVERSRKGTMGIAAMLGNQPSPNEKVLLEIADKLDTIIELLTQKIDQ